MLAIAEVVDNLLIIVDVQLQGYDRGTHPVKKHARRNDLTDSEILAIAEKNGVWVYSRALKIVDIGNGKSRIERDGSLTPAGGNILKFARELLKASKKP